VKLSPRQRAEAGEIAREIGRIARSGEVLAGSITERMKRCGRQGCRCMADPPRPHGPYFHWTRKVHQKTVGRWLSAEQSDDYRTWIENDRRLRELIGRLEAIGESVLGEDPRTGSRR
jgi:hypothetical protein